MRILRYVFMTVVAGTTLMAAGATFAKFGVPPVQYPQGISLKKESVRRGYGGIYRTGRSHYGGGIRGHK